MSTDLTRRDWLTHHATFAAIGVMSVGITVDGRGPGTLTKTTLPPPGGVLHFGPGTHVIDTNLTVPSTVLLQCDFGAILSIAAGKTVTINGPFQAPLTQLFTGAGTVVFGGGHLARVYPQWWGAFGDGQHDDAGAINAALVAAATGGIPVELVAGTYQTTAPIVLPDNTLLCGVPLKSIVRPTAALGTGSTLKLGNNCTIDGLYITGVDTRGATGLGVGTSTLVGNVVCRNMRIERFTGTGAQGILVTQCVTGQFENLYVWINDSNLVVDGGVSLPTDIVFLNCQFREATQKGIWLQSGRNLHFLKCLFESNSEEGVYVYHTTTVAPDNIVFQTCWFENNWRSLKGAARNAQYDVWIRGVSPAFTPTVSLKDCMFQTGGGAEQQIRLTDAYNFVIDHCSFGDIPSILIEGVSFGTFVNWKGSTQSYGAGRFFTGNAVVNKSTGFVNCTSPQRGIFRPVFADAATGGHVSPTVVTGLWERIGDMVHVAVKVDGLSMAGLTPGNALFCRELPFMSNASFPATAALHMTDLAWANSIPQVLLSPGTTYVRFPQYRSNVGEYFTCVSEVVSGRTSLSFRLNYTV